MTLEDAVAGTPWGLHDARLEALEIDWLGARASLSLRLMMSERQDLDRRARVDVTGLVFCAVDPPEAARGYVGIPDDGLWIDDGPGAAPHATGLPAVPEGCFLHWLFVQDWNRFIHLCARDARLTWLEPAPVAARGSGRALYPGDEIPDP